MIKFGRFVERATKYGVPLSTLMIEREAKKLSMPEKAVLRGMDKTYTIMREAAHAGMHYTEPYFSDITTDVAGQMDNYLKEQRPLTGSLMAQVTCRALSAAKSNSMMNLIVAAPSAGSSGVLPAVLTTLEDYYQISREI